MTIEQISDAAKRLKKKYDETDPERLAEQMKILVSREPMGLFEGLLQGLFSGSQAEKTHYHQRRSAGRPAESGAGP